MGNINTALSPWERYLLTENEHFQESEDLIHLFYKSRNSFQIKDILKHQRFGQESYLLYKELFQTDKDLFDLHETLSYEAEAGGYILKMIPAYKNDYVLSEERELKENVYHSEDKID